MFNAFRLFHLLGWSGQKYPCPIKPRRGESPKFWRGSPVHFGPFRHAVDIIVPDPRKRVLPVYAPASGVITCLVQCYTVWGVTEAFSPYRNYVQVSTEVLGEFYEICHIGAYSCRLRVGDRVEAGEKMATTGVNGWMTDPRHIHFMVGVWRDGPGGTFRSLRIRWRKP